MALASFRCQINILGFHSVPFRARLRAMFPTREETAFAHANSRCVGISSLLEQMDIAPVNRRGGAVSPAHQQCAIGLYVSSNAFDHQRPLLDAHAAPQRGKLRTP